MFWEKSVKKVACWAVVLMWEICVWVQLATFPLIIPFLLFVSTQASETLVLRSGDFLVRDSLSTVGDYVLTCRWQQEVIHSRISKVLVKSGQTKIQYMLEHESFDSVPTLVRHHAGTGRPVCPRTGAQLLCPVNRTLPLRYLEATFALAGGRPGSAHSPSTQRGAHIKRRSVTMTDGLTTEKIIPHR